MDPLVGEEEQLDNRRSRFSENRGTFPFAFALLLLVIEEVVMAFVDPILGLLISFVGAFVVVVLPYVVGSGQAVRGAMQCFSLLFLSRVAMTVVPALILSPSMLIVVVYGVYLSICAVYVAEKRLPLKDVGFRASSIRGQILGGLALGVTMGVVEFAILNPDISKYLLFGEFSPATVSYVLVVMFLFVGLGEELLFRGLVQTSFEKVFARPLTSVVIVSFLFAMMHAAYVTSLVTTLELVYVFVAATVIGYSFMKTRSLLLPVIAHGTANTILFGILPYML